MGAFWIAPLLAACALGPGSAALRWEPPVAAFPSEEDPGVLPPERRLARQFAEGVELDPQRAAALFPELRLDHQLIRRVQLQSERVALEGEALLLWEPRLRCMEWGGRFMELGVCTHLLIDFRLMASLHAPEPGLGQAPGPWVAEDRITLRREGWLRVGSLEP